MVAVRCFAVLGFYQSPSLSFLECKLHLRISAPFAHNMHIVVNAELKSLPTLLHRYSWIALCRRETKIKDLLFFLQQFVCNEVHVRLVQLAALMVIDRRVLVLFLLQHVTFFIHCKTYKKAAKGYNLALMNINDGIVEF